MPGYEMPFVNTINGLLKRLTTSESVTDSQDSTASLVSASSMFELEARVLYDASPLGVLLQPQEVIEPNDAGQDTADPSAFNAESSGDELPIFGGDSPLAFSSVPVSNAAATFDHGFSSVDATFGGLDHPSFTGRGVNFSDNRFVVDTSQSYDLNATAYATDAAGDAPLSDVFHYLGFASFDVDGNTIRPTHVYRHAGATDTTLAADLNPGDTQIELTDATGWYDESAPTAAHARSVAWYGYQDSTGHTYADYTYTRNVLQDLWDGGSISGNVITLRDAWDGPALLAGDAVRNATSGGSYNYGLLAASAVPDTPTEYTSTVGGGESTGDYSNTLFRPGTHSVQPLVLSNYTPTGDPHDTDSLLYVSNFELNTTTGNYVQGVTSFIENREPISVLDGDAVITDADDAYIESVVIELTNGKAGDLLHVDQADLNTFGVSVTGVQAEPLTADGTVTLTLTADSLDSVTKSDFIAALRTVRFENVSDHFNATDRNLTFVANDGELDSATQQLKIRMIRVNDAPQGADNTASGLEDVDYRFNVADFGFSDPVDGDDLRAIRIANLPEVGSLYLDRNNNGSVGVNELVAADQSIDARDIEAGRVKFKAPDGAFGDAYANFEFQVQDDGGTANHGDDLSNETNRITIDLAESFRIEGRILEDVNGDSNLSDALAVRGATVYLYQDSDQVTGASTGDTLVATTTTDMDGNYRFVGLLDGTYFVVVESNTITANGGYNVGNSIADVTAEQTYGSAGALVANGMGGTTALTASGSAFGGRLGGVSDDASSLTTAEHVTVVSSVVGIDVRGVDSAFSFNVVTTAEDSGQGSFRQFVENANAITGSNVMRFVPTVTTNASGANGDWWSVSLSAAIPSLTDANTTIDGTAYRFTDGVTVVDSNTGNVNSSRSVGVDGLILDAVARQELQIDFGGSISGIEIDANNAVVSNLALIGQNGSGATIKVTENVDTGGDATISRTVIGARADGTDPGTNSGYRGLALDGAAHVSNNFIAYLDGAGVRFNGLIHGNVSAITFENNEVAEIGGAHVAGDAATIDSTNVSFIGNYIHDVFVQSDVRPFNGKGVELWYNAHQNIVENNTIEAATTAGIGLGDNAHDNTISKNVITGTKGQPGKGGAGILITGAGSNGEPTGNTITRNEIHGNAGPGIDIDPRNDFVNGNGNGVDTNDGAITPGAVQEAMDHPVISIANLVANELTVSGYVGSSSNNIAFADARVEFFVATGDASGFGEGQRYLGSLTADANGTFSGTLAVIGLTAADEVTATATSISGSTSEFGLNIGVNGQPTFEASQRANVLLGGSVTLHTVNANTLDPDQPADQLRYIINGTPTYGSLQWNGFSVSVGDSFLQEDIDNGLVRYFRDETSAQTDFFTFDIADSQGLRLSGQSVELGVLTPATAGASDSEVANDTQDDAGEEASEPIAVAPSESGDSSDDDSDSEDDIALIPSNASNETFQQFIDRVATLETETNQLSKGSRIAREVTDPELVNEILIGLASQQKRNAQRDHEDADWEQNDKESFAQDTFLLWQKLEESSKTASIDLDVRLTVGTITVLGTFGGILWALRGGALMAVAFANLPGWNFVDPLPILESHHRRKLESKEGDLANFF